MAYEYKYEKKGDDLGVDVYAESPGEAVVLSSYIVSAEIVKKCQEAGKVVGILPRPDSDDAESFKYFEDYKVDFVITAKIDQTPGYKRS
jgi:hypothetical protein